MLAVELPTVRFRWSLVHSNMRPTRSVVDTPSVRLHSLHQGDKANQRRSFHDEPATDAEPADGDARAHVPVPSGRLDNVVRVHAVRVGCNVVAMHDKVNVVLVQRVELRDVGRVLHHLVHPLACTHSQISAGAVAVNGVGAYGHVSNFSNWPNRRFGAHRSSLFMTVGPLFFEISSSEWTPTTKMSPMALAWRALHHPAWAILLAGVSWGVGTQATALGSTTTYTCLMALACPKCIMSKQPSTHTRTGFFAPVAAMVAVPCQALWSRRVYRRVECLQH